MIRENFILFFTSHLTEMLLEVRDVTKKFGGLKAVDGCSLNLENGDILGLIGPNGSGKTTLFNSITGIYKIDSGQIYLKSRRIDSLKTHEIARCGIGRTFQVVRVFKNMTLLENMSVAGLHAPSKLKTTEREALAIELLKYVDLVDLKNQYAKNLSFGQQRLLEFAAALMFDPEVILLDEPVSGVNPLMIKKMMSYIRDLNSRGKTFIVIAHNMRVIMSLCNRIVVLSSGKKIAEDAPEQIKKDKAVIAAYLGG